MTVLHIIKGLGLAGAEKHLIALLSGLRERGVDARLLLWVSPTQHAADIVAAADQHGIPLERWIMPSLFAPRFFFKLARYLRQQKPDIVHTHLVHAETYAIPAARLAGVRYVVNSSHNDDPFRRRFVFRLRGWLLWRLTNRGIAISEAVKQFLIQIEHAPAAKIEVIYYGLEAQPIPASGSLRAELGLPPETPLIGSVCRLVPQKGIAYALDAMAILAERDPQWHYVILGDGVLKNDLMTQTHRLGLVERVHFLGWRTDVLELMAQLDIFVAPSLWEGFGLVFLEAMAAGKPIVSTRVSCIPEVVEDGVSGLLVPPENAAALAQAVARLLDDPDLARNMGAAGRQRLAEKFSQQHMVEQTLAVYQKLVAQP